MRFEALLGRTVRGFWASTYSFDLKLFDQYVLRRLAPSPLNAVVLADRDKLATVWEGLHEGQEYLARQVGRRYLLRGVAPPGGGAFHPKTYLFARADHATLIIGSGNLTRPGIDGGREVFTPFTTQRSEDLPTMRAWAQWMGRLVHRQVDPLLLERWTALREASPWITGDSDGSRFLSNDDESLLDQLARRLPGNIDDLHVTAPFFDPSADALRQLINVCSAKRVTLYVGAGAKVHGPALAGVLADHPNARVRRFEPQTFVHAKLIGVTVGGQGLLLSGSPNLSHAALTLTHADNGGNDEVAVLSEGTAAQVRDVFNGSGLDQIDEALDWLTSLTFADDHPAGAHALVLRSAQWRDDGRVQVRLGDGHGLPSDAMLGWEAAQRAAPLDEHGVTHEALDEADTSPVIVYIVDSDGAILSNRVVIDDPGALRETLVGSAAKRSTRPRELEDSEMVPLVRLVLWAHDKFIFDPDENAAFRRATEAAAENAPVEDATGFWERLATEELQYDPRMQSYKPLVVSGKSATPVDELLRELEMLLHAAPTTDTGPAFRVITTVVEGDPDDMPGHGAPWTMEARQRVRAFHVLMRWATALSDPRHALIDPHAPVANYETMLGIIVMAWVNGALQDAQARKLVLTALDGFVGPRQGVGFLGRCVPDETKEAVAHITEGFVELGAGLVYAALARPNWSQDIYDWQPAVLRGLTLGVLRPGPLSESLAAQLTERHATVADIDHLLAQRVNWIDEQTWCARLTRELDLRSLRLERRMATVKLAVVVSGCDKPLTDTRLLTVARRALDFKHESAIAVRAGTDTFVYEPGAFARAISGGTTYRSQAPVDSATLRAIEDQGGSWGDLLGIGRRSVAA